jgi:hypothetical protein
VDTPFPRISPEEQAKIQAAYDVLTALGRREGWDNELLDRAHQALGVILALAAFRAAGSPGPPPANR